MSEKELQKAVVGLAHFFGYKVAHFRTANTSQGWMTPVAADGKGFPDLVLVRRERLIFCELKAEKGRLSPEQTAWLAALVEAGVDVFVWRPVDWFSGAIEEKLR